MKLVIVVIFSLLVFSVATVGNAGTGNLCNKDGWTTAQSSSGQAFASQKECQKAKEVFTPSASIDPTRVVAWERFTLTATGFHPNTSVSILFAITGEAPYATYTPPTQTLADGSYSLPFVFAECRQIDTGGDVTVDLTLTLVDSYGVHASAGLTLC